MSAFLKIDISSFLDDRGELTVLDNLPFPIKRVFWIKGVSEKVRGGHRHIETRQILIALRGAVKVYVCDGVHEKHFDLANPSQALIVEPEDWHTMQFESDSIMLVLASHKYDPKDYIYEPYLIDRVT